MQIQTANYDLVTTWQGGMASRTRCQSMTGDKRQSHVIDSDESVALGGEGRAPGPQDLMLAAFNACMTAAFVQEAISAGITLTHLDIETRGELLTGMPLICKKNTDASVAKDILISRLCTEYGVRPDEARRVKELAKYPVICRMLCRESE